MVEQMLKELNEMYGTDVPIDDIEVNESEIIARMICGESFDSATQYNF